MPLLRAMQGDRRPLPRALALPLDAPFSRKAGRLELIRARLTGELDATRVHPFENQASGALTTLAWADALAVIPAETAELEQGALVSVLRIIDF
jgi:molybdopterin molybdotransferase